MSIERDRCVLCGKADRADRLIAACRCYKKSDSNRVHARCLEQKFEEHQSDEPLRCPKCRDVYTVSVQFRFKLTWNKLLSCRSLGHCFEFFIVLIMIVCGGFTISVFRRSPEFKQQAPEGGGAAIIYVLFGITVLLVPLTLKKVYERWKKANATPEIVDLV